MATNPETQYQRLAEKLRDAVGAEISQMFGMPTLKLNSKAFAGYSNGEMVFKLTGDSHTKALAQKGAHLFDPMGTGRTMKEWVQLPAAVAAK